MSEEELLEKIEQVLDQVRPNLQMDGGDVEFIKFDDGVVYLRFQGTCIGCPASVYTLRLGIEQALKDQISDITKVIAVE